MDQQIYGLSTDPYRDEDGIWQIGVLWVDNDTGNMGSGSLNLPNYLAVELLQKHFRRNVTPLSDEKLQELLDTAMKGIMH
jgi:hypothetical protein